MTNMHIKTIKGKKYYYESVRKGKKVTSRYIGPVDRKSKKKEKRDIEKEDLLMPEDSYIG